MIKKLMAILMMTAPLMAATPPVTPKADNEGSIGLSTVTWNNGYFYNLNAGTMTFKDGTFISSTNTFPMGSTGGITAGTTVAWTAPQTFNSTTTFNNYVGVINQDIFVIRTGIYTGGNSVMCMDYGRDIYYPLFGLYKSSASGTLQDIPSGQILGSFVFGGKTGSGFHEGSKIVATTAEDWNYVYSADAHAEKGNYLSFYTNKIDSGTILERMRIEDDGQVYFWNQIEVASSTLATDFQTTSNASQAGFLRLKEKSGSGTNYTQIQSSQTLGSDLSFTLPDGYGSSGQAMLSNGAGELYFGSVATSGLVASDSTTITGQWDFLNRVRVSSAVIATEYQTAQSATEPGYFRLFEISGSGSNYVHVQSSQTLSSNLLFTLPPTYGSAGNGLITNGAGEMYWGTVTGTGGDFLVSPSTGILSGTLATGVKITTGNVVAGGTASASTFLRGDGSWAAGGAGGDVYLASTQTFTGGNIFSVNSTSFTANIYVSSMVQAGSLNIPQSSTTGGYIKLYGLTGTTTYAGFIASNTVFTEQLYALPDRPGTAGQVLATAGTSSGISNLYWTTASGGPSGELVSPSTGILSGMLADGVRVTTSSIYATGWGATKYLRGDGTWQTIGGGGDMLKSTYDTDDDSIVDTAETFVSSSSWIAYDSYRLQGTTYVTPSNIYAGTLPSYVIASSHSVSSVVDNNIVSLAGTKLTGEVPIANGGTNASSFSGSKFLYFDGSKIADSAYYNTDFAAASHNQSATTITAGTLLDTVRVSTASIIASGTAGGTVFLSGDASWSAVAASNIGAGTLGTTVIASSIAVYAIDPRNNIKSGAMPTTVIASSVAVNTIYPNNNFVAGTLPTTVIASSIAVNAVIDNNISGTITASKIASGTLGTGVIASSIAVYALDPRNNIKAGAMPTTVIASSVAVNTIYPNNNFIAGTLPNTVIASSIAVNTIRPNNVNSGSYLNDIIVSTSMLTREKIGSYTVSITTPYALGVSTICISNFAPIAVTISTCSAICIGGGSVSFKIQQKANTGIASAGTDIWGASVSAGTTWTGYSSFADATMPQDYALFLLIQSITGEVQNLIIRYKWIE